MQKPNLSAAAGLLATVCLIAATLISPAMAQAPNGAALFEQRCKSCHDPAVERAPAKAELALRPRGDIVKALTAGVMMPMALGMSQEDIQAVAAYLAPESTGVENRPVAVSKPSVGEDPPCKAGGSLSAGKSDWPTYGLEDSSRFNPNPGFKASEVGKLKLKWSFAMSGGESPVVVGNWLFVTNRSGKLYALDTKSGCVHWMNDDVVARAGPTITRSNISPSGFALIVSASDKTVRAYDAQNGKQIWKSEMLEDHGSSTLTGAPVVEGGWVFVPVSSIEEATSMRKDYVCCTFRGSLVSLDLSTGKRRWKTFVITAPVQTIHRPDKDLKGPAGGAVWASPTVDKKRGLIYIVTGDSYTDLDTDGDDAVFAIDMELGTVRWHTQVTQHDNFVMGCGPKSTTGNCPTPVGPDYDFGATPVLMNLKGGKQMLVAGQKSGIVYGFDPDTGAVQWKTTVGEGSALGGVEWGIAADRNLVYVPVSDIGRLLHFGGPGDSPGKPGLNAIDPSNGKVVWSHAAPEAACHYAYDKDKQSLCVRAQSAGNAVIPGVVFSGTLDGWFRAYDAKNGNILWEYSTTAQTYDTVNGVKGQPGGGIDGAGPTIADGMVFTMSGFNGAARIGANGTNVLLAFEVVK